MPEPNQLQGWKQIAGYLRVSIRTAQALEKQGLPVYRGPGEKSPVSAFAAEIDEWRARSMRAPLADAPPDEAATRRRWIRYGLSGIAAGLAAIAGVAGFRRLRWRWTNPPASCRVQGLTLVVYDQDNVELWRYTLPKIMYRSGSPCVFADLSGAGRRDTLLIYAPVNGSVDPSYLVCFRPDGSRRWEYKIKKTVTDNRGRQFSPPYAAIGVAPFRRRGDAAERIALLSIHNYSFPSQLAILDGRNGEVAAEYWHRGHLMHLAVADLDGDGEPELLAGGVNDAPEYKQATLLVFDHRRVEGATPNPGGGSYFRGIAPFAPKHTIFFPRSPVSQGQEFNRVHDLIVQPERILVDVAEGIDEYASPSIVYEFDSRLRLVNITPTDTFLNRLREMQLRGEIPAESPEAVAGRLRQGVRVL